MSGPEPDSATVETGPNEWHDPIVRNEAKRAATWIGLVGLAALVVLLIQPILLIVAGAFIAVMFDGGARLLGRVLPVGRGWRLLIVVLGVTTFLLGTVYLGGVEIAAQFGQLRDTLTVQSARLSQLLNRTGLLPDSIDLASFSQQLSRSVGMLTSMLGAAFGGLTAIFLIAVIGLFLAMDPGTYARGTVWLFPRGRRDEMALLIDRIGFTLRRLFAGRLLGMAFEGTLTWIALTLGGVPMALLLGILSGILAFSAEHRRVHHRHPDGRGWLFGRHGDGPVGVRHLCRRPDLRRLCRDPDRGQEDGRPAARPHALHAGAVRRALRPDRPGAGRSDHREPQGHPATLGRTRARGARTQTGAGRRDGV